MISIVTSTCPVFLQEFWWAVLLMGIGFVIFMAIFIRCFAIHTPSSNPNLPKNLHFTETLRRPVRSLQKQVRLLSKVSDHGKWATCTQKLLSACFRLSLSFFLLSTHNFAFSLSSIFQGSLRWLMGYPEQRDAQGMLM